MSLEEALIITKQACASIVANLDVHSRVQEALGIIEEALTLDPKSDQLADKEKTDESA